MAYIYWRAGHYDFDQAGVINAEYAAPAEQLRLRSVRQRLWRGRCIHSSELDAVIALFNDQRTALESALVDPEARQAKAALKYVDGFYKIINDPKKRQKNIDQRCMRS